MDDFLSRLSAALGVPEPDAAEVDAILTIARDVAHGAERRYAPLTAFLVGIAIGRGSSLPAAAAAVGAALSPRES